MSTSYRIETRTDEGHWHVVLGDATGWVPLAAARAAVKSLRETCPDEYGDAEIRIVRESDGRVFAEDAE